MKFPKSCVFCAAGGKKVTKIIIYGISVVWVHTKFPYYSIPYICQTNAYQAHTKVNQ